MCPCTYRNVKKMGQLWRFDPKTIPDSKKEGLITALYIGCLFIILAVVYLLNLRVNLWGNVTGFVSTFIFTQVPGTSIWLPAPANPAAYIALYKAVFQFCIGVGILEIVVFTVRNWFNSPLPRKAETIENIVFWLGTGYLVITYLVNITIISEWFVFWAGIILVGGLSLIARSFVLMANRRT